jgi:hydroxymethylpyrimidine/phosphomethylpyrimidine kinase
MPGDPHDRIMDMLFRPGLNGGFTGFPVTRVDTRHTHGTGCTLASAIAAGLALGWDVDRAVTRAFTYVQLAIRASPWLGHGHGPIGHALDVVPFELIHKKEW